MAMTHAERLKRRRDIVAESARGRTVPELCEQFGVGEGTVKAALREAGVRPVLGPRRNGRNTPSYAILADLLNTALSLREIARRHSVSAQAVQQIYIRARSHGIRVPDRCHGGKGSGWASTLLGDE
jgi:transposase-like protein